jgi:hypothetical protein
MNGGGVYMPICHLIPVSFFSPVAAQGHELDTFSSSFVHIPPAPTLIKSSAALDRTSRSSPSLSPDACFPPCLPYAHSTSSRSHSPHLQQVNTKTSRAECLVLAKLAEQAERWDGTYDLLLAIPLHLNLH